MKHNKAKQPQQLFRDVPTGMETSDDSTFWLTKTQEAQQRIMPDYDRNDLTCNMITSINGQKEESRITFGAGRGGYLGSAKLI